MPDRLTMEAELRDRLSPGIRNIKKELAGVGVTPGMNQATAWVDTFANKAEAFARTGTNAGSVMTAMGVGGLTAAASVAGLVAQMKELGERSLAMRELGRETGLATDYVNAFSHAGARFGVSADTMQSALNHLAEQMPQFKRGFGELHDQLAGRWPDFTKKLQLDGAEDQLRDIIEQIGKIKDPQIQKSYLDLFFGNGADVEKLFQAGPKALLDELSRQQKTLAPITTDMLRQAQTFREAQVDFNSALENFERSAGPAFLGTMSELLKDSKQFVDTLGHGNEHGSDKSPDHRDHRSWSETFTDALRDAWRAPDEIWKKLSDATADGGPLYHKQAFRGGSGGLLQLAAYGGGAGGGGTAAGLEDTLASGVKEGTLAAFRELMAAGSAGATSSGGNGLTLASFGGGGGFGAGIGGRGVGGGSFSGNAGVGGWWTKDNIDHGVNRLMKEAGLTRAGAEGLISRWAGVEAPGGPTSVNGSSGAFGIGQWLGSRKAGAGASYDQQLSHAIGELNGSERRAGDVLRRARSAREGAIGASMYERAEGYNPSTGVDNFTSKSEAVNGRLGAGAGIGAHLRVLNEECVSLAKAAVGATGSVTEWRRGVGALAGTLKPGTPVATFMDSMGRLSDRYAGGGTGTRGANRDHAAIFQSYIRDKSGNITGMHVLEQSAGHPQHMHDYYSGGGAGEHDARNYYGIMGPNGRSLGGDRNPMNRRASGLAVHERRGHR